MGEDIDLEEQEDELLALDSIFGPEIFKRLQRGSRNAGEVQVHVEMPQHFSVTVRDGKGDAAPRRQYVISHLSPLLVKFNLPGDYPSSCPPTFTLTCFWLTRTQLSALGAHLNELYQATGGTVVLFTWVQFLREECLSFLNINSLLEINSDQSNTPSSVSFGQNAPFSESEETQWCSNGNLEESAASSDSSEADRTHCTTNLSNDGPNTLTSWPDSDNRQAKTPNMKAVHGVTVSEPVTAKPSISANAAHQVSDGQILQITDVNTGHQHASTSEENLSQLQSFSGQQRGQDKCQTSDPQQTLVSHLLIYNETQKQKAFEAAVFDCGVCLVSFAGSECTELSQCGHIYCHSCLAEHFKGQITEGDVRAVACPQPDCSATPTPGQVRRLVGEELFVRYDRLLFQMTLDTMSDVVYCPRRFCGSAIILEADSRVAQCSVCSFAFCVSCRRSYHGIEACQEQESNSRGQKTEEENFADFPQSEDGIKALLEDYFKGSAERKELFESRYRCVFLVNLQEHLSQGWLATNCKYCPRCHSLIQKDGGCNLVNCIRCRQYFCWGCLKKLSTENFRAHSCSTQDESFVVPI